MFMKPITDLQVLTLEWYNYIILWQLLVLMEILR